MFDAAYNRLFGAGPVLWSWLQLGGSAVGAGVAIKLMDDHLDGMSDRIAGLVTPAQRLGAGAMPYALLSLLGAALLRIDAATALFLGAYSAGMAHDWREYMPTGAPAWLESALAFLLAVVGSGLSLAGAAVCLMVFIQCVDDILDVLDDRAAGARNAVSRLGVVETHFLAGSALLFAVSLSPELTLAVFGAMAVIDGLFRRATVRAARDGRSTGGGP